MKKLIFTLIIIHYLFIIANAQWVQMSNGIELGVDQNVYSFTKLGNIIFAGTDQHGVYISTNYGINWTQTALNSKTIYSLTTLGNNIFAGTRDSGVYLSTNNGTSWTQTALNDQLIRSLTTPGNNIFAGTDTYPIGSGGIYISTNNGANWTQSGMSNITVYALVTLGNFVFAGAEDGIVYLSTNNGTNWTQTLLIDEMVFSLTISGYDIYAGTDGYGVFRSTDNGTVWSQTSLDDESILSFAVSGNNIFAGTRQQGIYLSTNKGTNWTKKNEGIQQNHIYINGILITDDYVFIGINNPHSVWRRDLHDILTGAQNISTEKPSRFSLYQNYPNPFNPTTKIKFDIAQHTPYSLSRGESVSLKVYDIMGREVATLLDEQLAPGTYSVDWNATQYPSGVYFYKLTSYEFSETKKMLLIK